MAYLPSIQSMKNYFETDENKHIILATCLILDLGKRALLVFTNAIQTEQIILLSYR